MSHSKLKKLSGRLNLHLFTVKPLPAQSLPTEPHLYPSRSFDLCKCLFYGFLFLIYLLRTVKSALMVCCSNMFQHTPLKLAPPDGSVMPLNVSQSRDKASPLSRLFSVSGICSTPKCSRQKRAKLSWPACHERLACSQTQRITLKNKQMFHRQLKIDWKVHPWLEYTVTEKGHSNV